MKDFASLHVHPVSQKNAWNNLVLMARIIIIIAFALRRHLAESQPILLSDGSRAPLHAVLFQPVLGTRILLVVF